MKKEQSMFKEIYDYTATLQTKIGKKVHERFECDDFDVIMYDNVWYIQSGNRKLSLYNYIYKWINNYMKRKHNAIWLYEG